MLLIESLMNAVFRASGHFEGSQNLSFDLDCKHTNKSGLPYTKLKEKSFRFLILFFIQCVKYNESLTEHWLPLSAERAWSDH